MRDDLADRKIMGLKMRTLSPIFETWLNHPNHRVRLVAREMRSSLVAVDCQRCFVERCYYQAGTRGVVAYLRSLVWRMKQLTDDCRKAYIRKKARAAAMLAAIHDPDAPIPGMSYLLFQIPCFSFER
jgi:hypothetical protein